MICRAPFEYNLIINSDYYTVKHMQWFYFFVANTRKNIPYKFNIINMIKPDSLYNQGLKPLFYSLKRFEFEGKTFFRDGTKICYYTNNLKKKGGGNFSTLTFTATFSCKYHLTHRRQRLRVYITRISIHIHETDELPRHHMCRRLPQEIH